MLQSLRALWRRALRKTREGLWDRLKGVFGGKTTLSGEEKDQIEELLYEADLGVPVVERLLAAFGEGGDAAAVQARIRDTMLEALRPVERPDLLAAPAAGRQVLLVVGVNGSGKTTTIAKLAHRVRQEGKTVLLCAADTFRAAAIEQLQEWGRRLEAPVVAQEMGSDPAAVAYDGLHAARSRDLDVVIVDTAGRLHTKTDLMGEMQKIQRILTRENDGVPPTTLLVLDANSGQNGLNQVQQFHDAVGVDGLLLSKMDGTAKGGILLRIAEEVAVPVGFLGVGERLEDLVPFSAEAFVDAVWGAGTAE